VKRTIAVITTSRADYSHLYWPLQELAAHSDLALKLIVLGPHLSPEFGRTVAEIERDGFRIDARIECLLSSDTDVGMAKTIGVAALGLADCLASIRPDILLLTADRYEMLAPASVALALRIPVAHIEGGELSEGAIDDAVRNALTKLSQIHFTSTETAKRRVIAMGEEPWRVHRTGAPSLDHLKRSKLRTREQIEEELGLDLNQPTALVVYHPATILRDTTAEADAFFAALDCLNDQLVFCYPNSDAGSRALIERTKHFMQAHRSVRIFTNLNPVSYWSLLRSADMLIGNSSSGIMEAASFGIPVVNVGIRQQGRERARNTLDCDANKNAILEKIAIAKSRNFRKSLEGMENPYGDGDAARRIVRVLASAPLGTELLMKRRNDENPPFQS
jgi:UDP-hydrolysing UDP-N-acetyl-D-glucosamine 2-epimerase